MGTHQFQTIPLRALILCVAMIACVSSGVYGQTNNSYPMLMSLRPTAAQIGASTDHELNARYNLAGATQVIVSGEGVRGEVLPNEQEKPEDQNRNDVMASKCKIRFTVDANVVPGVRDFRVITPHGASTVGQLVVGRDTVISEIAGNDTRDKAQEVALPATLCGAIEQAEDLDYFKFKVEAGVSLTFHVRAQRLLNRLHDMQTRVDPMITLRSDTGAILASSDNYYAGDPLMNFKFERAGDYFLEVRDVRYQGNADWTYSIEVSDRPFVTQVHPMAVPVGASTQVALVGFQILPGATVAVTPNAESPDRIQWVAATLEGKNTNDFAIVPTTLPIVVEPPNVVSAQVAADGSNAPAAAKISGELTTVPAVIAGRIEEAGEIDRYVFQAKAQEKFSFEVMSRRGWSGMDPVVRVLNEQGAPLVENDDATYRRVSNSDSWLENWTAPADGKYQLEIRDLHQRGGPQFTYAVQVTRPDPFFLLEIDTDKSLLAPGMSADFHVRVLRKNGFAGEIQLNVEGLPAGVTAIAGRIPADITDGCIILQAAPDAALGATNVRVTGTATHVVPNAVPIELRAIAQPMQEYYSPGGGRGHYPVDMLTVSVEKPMDLRAITLSTNQIDLKPGTSQKIDITVQRAPDFKGNVTLDVIMQHLEQPFGNSLPKGVKMDVAASKTLLTGDETAGFITLTAAPDAPAIEKQLVPIQVHVSINFVMKHTLCGGPVYVTVAK